MFGFIVTIFNNLLYYPLLNGLVLIYNYLPGHDFGLAIVLLTIVIRFILYPVSVKAVRSQKVLQKLQPEIEKIQEKYKGNKEKQATETLELYRKEKINPFGGLFLALVQLPILIALYNVFWKGLGPRELEHLYGFVSNPVNINSMFFNLIDLAKPNLIFAVLAGIFQFVQTKMLIQEPKKGQAKKNDISSMMQKQMIYVLPFVTVLILFKLPSALGLYWIVSGVFSIVQQWLILKKLEAENKEPQISPI